MEIPVLPFRIMALAPLCPLPETGYTPQKVDVDLTTLDEAMAAIGPRFTVPVPKDLCSQAELTLEFTQIKDFKPEIILKKNPYLKDLNEARAYLEKSLQSGVDPQEIASGLRSDWAGLPPELTAPPEKFDSARKTEVDDILAMVAMPHGSTAPSTSHQDWKGRFDRVLTALMNHIFGDPIYRAYEAAWRGIQTLLRQGPVKEGQGVSLSLISVNRANLSLVLDHLLSEPVSALPNLVLIDLPFDDTPASIELLEKVARFSESMLAPTAVWITPRFFHLDAWTDLKKLQYLKNHLEDASYAKWRKLAESSAANWLLVSLNRFVGRLPYGIENPPRGVAFEEPEPLWLSPVWALGALCAQSTVKFGWPSRFTDYANVALTDLPLANLSGEGPISAEVRFSEDRIYEFIEVGLSPLLAPYRKDQVIMPKEATLIGGSFKYQMILSRILGFLFWSQDNLAEAIRQGDVAANLKTALARFWERTGHHPPEDISVEASAGEDGGTLSLNIRMTLPTTILPGNRLLEFTLAWSTETPETRPA